MTSTTGRAGRAGRRPTDRSDGQLLRFIDMLRRYDLTPPEQDVARTLFWRDGTKAARDYARACATRRRHAPPAAPIQGVLIDSDAPDTPASLQTATGSGRTTCTHCGARLRVRHVIPYGVLCTECHDHRQRHHALRPLGDGEALRRCALLGHDLAPVVGRSDDRRRWRCQRAGCRDTLVDYRQRAGDPPQWIGAARDHRCHGGKPVQLGLALVTPDPAD